MEKYIHRVIRNFEVFVIIFSMTGITAFKNLNREDVACFPRDFGPGERVCVCNDTYCDTIKPPQFFPSRMFMTYTSNKEGLRFAFGRKNLAAWINPKSVKIIVNSSKTFQKIIGFGGCLSDAAAININNLKEGSRHRLLSSYFSDDGIEYTLVKIPIGGNDYSNRTFTLDEVIGDVSLKYFNLSSEDIHLKIPFLKIIRKLSNNSLELLGTSWTAPPWMKTNSDYKGAGVLNDNFYSLWSKYHLRFLEEYNKHGIQFWGLSTGFQPSTGLLPFYPYNCMGWTPFSQSKWIAENLGPDLKNSNFNSTKIIAVDDSRFFLPWWPKLIFNNDKTKSFVSGIGVQWYWNFIFPPRLIDLTHLEFPEKFILSTEASFNKWKGSITKPVLLGSWRRAEEYAENIVDDLNHWVSGWMDSNLALDLEGGPSWASNFADAAIIVNGTKNEFYKQPMFYALGHFSKFIPKGSFRIEVKVSRSGIKAAGFRTPNGKVVVVSVNKKAYDIPVTVMGAKKGNANILLPKKSITTIIYRDKRNCPYSDCFNKYKNRIRIKTEFKKI